MSSDQTPSWLLAAKEALEDAPLGVHAEQHGRVEEIADGVATISGLPDVGLEEVLHFARGQLGFVQVLDEDRIGCVLVDTFDAGNAVEAGDAVHASGDVVQVPVGEVLLGRVVDPLGRPLDDLGPLESELHWPIERPAPSIIERELVT